MLRKSLLAGVALLLTASVAEPFPLGGSSPNTGGGGGGGGGGSPTISGPDAFLQMIAGMTPGTWKAIPTSNMSAVTYSGPSAGTLAGTNGPSAVMEDWSGAALDTNLEQLIVWGGGHNNYFGNEVYGFKLSTLSWSLLTKPDTDYPAVYGGNDVTGAGNPVSRHSYDAVAFLPTQGLFFAVHGNDKNSNSWPDTFTINLATQSPASLGAWVQHDNFPASNVGGSGAFPGSVAVYDSTSGHVFWVAADVFGLDEWNPSASVGSQWTISQPNTQQLPHAQMVGAIKPGTTLVVAGNGSTVTIPISGGSKGVFAFPTTTGDKTVENANAPGFVYHPPSGKFIGWNGGLTTYQFDTGTNIWTPHAATANPLPSTAANTPTAVQIDGTYGRFEYDWQHGAFLAVNATAENVYTLKSDICPSGSPSPDQSVMIQPSACTLVDVAASAWTFPAGGNDDGYGNKTVARNGTDFTHTTLVGINLGGNLYFGTQAAFSPYFLYTRRNQGNGEFYQVAGVNSAVPSPPFTNSTTATTFQSMQDMFGAAGPNQTLTAHVMPSGIPAYSDFGTVNQANTTLNCDAGVIIAASNGAGPGQGIFAVEANGFTVNGCEISWTQATASNGPNVGIQIDHGFTGFTGTNLNLHDNDMNILGGGQTGAITLTNVTAKRGGSKVGAGSGDGFNHNIYLSWNSASPDTDSVTMTGGGSFDVTADGDDLKFRLATGTVKGVKVGCDTAGNEGTHAGCWENWPVDIGCGGQYTLGAAGAGNGIVIERSLGAVKSQLVSFGEDIPAGAPNCPNVARASQSLVITNAILIDDGPVGDGGATTVVNNPQSKSVTVSNSKLVCGANSSCASIAAFLGTGVTNGGGNTLFANRAAAGLAAYPALPSSP